MPGPSSTPYWDMLDPESSQIPVAAGDSFSRFYG